MQKVTINKSMCIGCGVCASMCPDGFEMKDDDSGMPKASVKTPDADEISTIKDAAEICPVACIHITETKTGKKLI